MSAGRGDLAGADRPDRLVGDCEPRRYARMRASPMREGGIELRLDGRDGLAGFAHVKALADAENDRQARGERRLRLGPDVLVALALGLAPLANGRRWSGSRRHRAAWRQRYAAGVGALLGEMDVLRADREIRHGARRPLDQDASAGRARHRRPRRRRRRRRSPESRARSAASPCIFQLPTTYLRSAILHPCLMLEPPSAGMCHDWKPALDGRESRT